MKTVMVNQSAPCQCARCNGGTHGSQSVVPVEESPFLAPVNPFLLNEQQVSALKTKVTEAETALRHAESSGKAWVEVTRLEQSLKAAQRELASSAFERRLERQRQQIG